MDPDHQSLDPDPELESPDIPKRVEIRLRSRIQGRNRNTSTTGLPDYRETGYSDIPATVTVFGSKKGSHYTENPGYNDILLTVTFFGRPNTVTVSGEACTVRIVDNCGIAKVSQ